MPKVVVSREQWLQKGMEMFAQGGQEALVIEKMAAALQCSKSSFYWYFSNRSEFVRQIVEEWRARTTHQVIHTLSDDAEADEKMLVLLRQMFSVTMRGDFLFYLRKLALEDEAYAAVLEETEQLRIDFASRIFVQKGFSEEIALQKAWLLYHYYLGWYERHKHTPVSEEQLEKHVGLLRKEWFGGRAD
ncbi:TetR/AcrR family transcriptional regulator [Paenibacillus sp. NEAU-GSW1]|uniref:TetR/AcrR family transcriptional regulator n=1 Tax=Paenibacillus sp. NEAU-GSW1 TaxID=2682486 RepID=UPI0012E1D0DA|nr:TetR/AcrR family transcriptional regulator [Paenibacillus sp. NEAU-GSW1]MUT64821.1 TetR family transcriptional regulator [Paenibacillus sp. NEAU-GSW1]